MSDQDILDAFREENPSENSEDLALLQVCSEEVEELKQLVAEQIKEEALDDAIEEASLKSEDLAEVALASKPSSSSSVEFVPTVDKPAVALRTLVFRCIEDGIYGVSSVDSEDLEEAALGSEQHESSVRLIQETVEVLNNSSSSESSPSVEFVQTAYRPAVVSTPPAPFTINGIPSHVRELASTTWSHAREAFSLMPVRSKADKLPHVNSFGMRSKCKACKSEDTITSVGTTREPLCGKCLIAIATLLMPARSELENSD